MAKLLEEAQAFLKQRRRSLVVALVERQQPQVVQRRGDGEIALIPELPLQGEALFQQRHGLPRLTQAQRHVRQVIQHLSHTVLIPQAPPKSEGLLVERLRLRVVLLGDGGDIPQAQECVGHGLLVVALARNGQALLVERRGSLEIPLVVGERPSRVQRPGAQGGARSRAGQRQDRFQALPTLA